MQFNSKSDSSTSVSQFIEIKADTITPGVIILTLLRDFFLEGIETVSNMAFDTTRRIQKFYSPQSEFL